MEDMINSPWETVSDSFYFVEGKLIMHTSIQKLSLVMLIAQNESNGKYDIYMNKM